MTGLILIITAVCLFCILQKLNRKMEAMSWSDDELRRVLKMEATK